jgi:hypothetical protein
VLEQAQEHVRSVGNLLFQPTLRRADGSTARLDALLGPGFAVLGRSQADLHMSDGARAILDRLGGRAVSLEGLEAAEGRIDPCFEDHPAAVVRPDRYVFGVVDAERDLEHLLRDLAGKLALR